MEFKLNLNLPKSNVALTHKDSVVLIGSCFSDEISRHFRKAGFDIESNTFGTLFHPIAIANVLNSALEDDQIVHVDRSADLYFSWDSASKVYGTNENSLSGKVIELRQQLKEKLSKAEVLVITFGTAWGYRHNALDFIVGNCHKAPMDTFERKLSGNKELIVRWTGLIERLKEFNPKLRIVITVSPVRHKKDGLIQNNRSKARLIELAHRLAAIKNVDYFPSYEILIDELRDYRFYSDDLVHPSALAVEYIWTNFSEFLVSDDTLILNKEVVQIKTELAHRSLHPESLANKKRLANVQAKKKALSEKHPEIHWE